MKDEFIGKTTIWDLNQIAAELLQIKQEVPS